MRLGVYPYSVVGYRWLVTVSAFYKHMFDLLESIEDCEAKRRTLPCLTLLYAGMDVMASLDSRPGEGVQVGFVRWVDTYLLMGRSLDCTALDLYAARCGVVHTFTADSDLHRKGKARKIQYAWGNADVAKLARSTQSLGYDIASVHLRDLIDAFRNAVANHLDAVASDTAKTARFEEMAGLWFCDMKKGIIDDFLELVDRSDIPTT
jgi:hypothetical protein